MRFKNGGSSLHYKDSERIRIVEGFWYLNSVSHDPANSEFYLALLSSSSYSAIASMGVFDNFADNPISIEFNPALPSTGSNNIVSYSNLAFYK